MFKKTKNPQNLSFPIPTTLTPCPQSTAPDLIANTPESSLIHPNLCPIRLTILGPDRLAQQFHNHAIQRDFILAPPTLSPGPLIDIQSKPPVIFHIIPLLPSFNKDLSVEACITHVNDDEMYYDDPVTLPQQWDLFSPQLSKPSQRGQYFFTSPSTRYACRYMILPHAAHAPSRIVKTTIKSTYRAYQLAIHSAMKSALIKLHTEYSRGKDGVLGDVDILTDPYLTTPEFTCVLKPVYATINTERFLAKVDDFCDPLSAMSPLDNMMSVLAHFNDPQTAPIFLEHSLATLPLHPDAIFLIFDPHDSLSVAILQHFTRHVTQLSANGHTALFTKPLIVLYVEKPRALTFIVSSWDTTVNDELQNAYISQRDKATLPKSIIPVSQLQLTSNLKALGFNNIKTHIVDIINPVAVTRAFDTSIAEIFIAKYIDMGDTGKHLVEVDEKNTTDPSLSPHNIIDISEESLQTPKTKIFEYSPLFKQFLSIAFIPKISLKLPQIPPSITPDYQYRSLRAFLLNSNTFPSVILNTAIVCLNAESSSATTMRFFSWLMEHKFLPSPQDREFYSGTVSFLAFHACVIPMDCETSPSADKTSLKIDDMNEKDKNIPDIIQKMIELYYTSPPVVVPSETVSASKRHYFLTKNPNHISYNFLIEQYHYLKWAGIDLDSLTPSTSLQSAPIKINYPDKLLLEWLRFLAFHETEDHILKSIQREMDSVVGVGKVQGKTRPQKRNEKYYFNARYYTPQHVYYNYNLYNPMNEMNRLKLFSFIYKYLELYQLHNYFKEALTPLQYSIHTKYIFDYYNESGSYANHFQEEDQAMLDAFLATKKLSLPSHNRTHFDIQSFHRPLPLEQAYCLYRVYFNQPMPYIETLILEQKERQKRLGQLFQEKNISKNQTIPNTSVQEPTVCPTPLFSNATNIIHKYLNDPINIDEFKHQRLAFSIQEVPIPILLEKGDDLANSPSPLFCESNLITKTPTSNTTRSFNDLTLIDDINRPRNNDFIQSQFPSHYMVFETKRVETFDTVIPIIRSSPYQYSGFIFPIDLPHIFTPDTHISQKNIHLFMNSCSKIIKNLLHNVSIYQNVPIYIILLTSTSPIADDEYGDFDQASIDYFVTYLRLLFHHSYLYIPAELVHNNKGHPMMWSAYEKTGRPDDQSPLPIPPLMESKSSLFRIYTAARNIYRMLNIWHDIHYHMAATRMNMMYSKWNIEQ